MRRALFGAAIIMSASVLLAPNHARAETFTLRIASGHSPSWHFIKLTQDFFINEVKERVAERTDHEVDFVEAFSGSVARTTEVLSSVQTGIVDLGVFCICHEAQRLALNNFPMYLPFGPSDPEVSVKATRAVYDKIPELDQQFERHGQRLLSLVPFEPYNIVSRSPISTAAEVGGLRIGAAGPNAFWVESAGALPVSVAGPDMYTSLQTGLIDSMVIFLSVMDSLKLFEVAPNFIDVSFGSMTVTSLTMNSRRFDGLPTEVQEIIVEVGREMEEKAGTYTKELVDKTLANVSSGVNVVKVAEEERQAWAAMLSDTTRQLAQRFETEQNVPMRDVMRAYYEATEAVGYTWPVKASLE